MTRINIIPTSELTTKHLVAEYREIARLPNNLRQSLSRAKPFSLSEIPTNYVLGTGHVKFFYNKMMFLQQRFDGLVSEMLRRGYNPTYRDSSIFVPEDKTFYNDWIPSEKDMELNRKRIMERLIK
jgi:deoxyribonuclease (pyrimidine dimer)